MQERMQDGWEGALRGRFRVEPPWHVLRRETALRIELLSACSRARPAVYSLRVIERTKPTHAQHIAKGLPPTFLFDPVASRRVHRSCQPRILALFLFRPGHCGFCRLGIARAARLGRPAGSSEGRVTREVGRGECSVVCRGRWEDVICEFLLVRDGWLLRIGRVVGHVAWGVVAVDGALQGES